MKWHNNGNLAACMFAFQGAKIVLCLLNFAKWQMNNMALNIALIIMLRELTRQNWFILCASTIPN